MSMHTRQLLSLFILNTLFILCTSVCRYEEDLILWNNTNYPRACGFYQRDYSVGVRGFDDFARGHSTLCSTSTDADYNGTYIYYLPHSSPTLYLFQFHDKFEGHSKLIISEGICATSSTQFQTAGNVAILDGTNCDWTQLDSDNVPAVTWYTGGDVPLNGSTQLCDRNSGCFTTNPTNSPTKSPVPTTAAPSTPPTTAAPSTSPTSITASPTKGPTRAPTVKPTNLPTVTSPDLLEPPCVAMTVTNLHLAFPAQGMYDAILRINNICIRTHNI